MNKICLVLILSIIISICNCDNVPVIDVYVESLCPDCMDFIGGSFKAFHANKENEKLAIVNFYSYGNANEKLVGDKWEFTCQHGENECVGNTLETCVMNKLPKSEGQDLLICIEGKIRSLSKDFILTLNACVSDENLRKEILDCSNSAEGNKLEHEVAQKTPKHNYVPWIQFNGEHNVDFENKIIDNMLEFLCGLQETKIEGCNNNATRANYIFDKNKVKNKSCLKNISSVSSTLKFLDS